MAIEQQRDCVPVMKPVLVLIRIALPYTLLVLNRAGCCELNRACIRVFL